MTGTATAPITRVPLIQLEAATLLSGAGNGAAMVVLPWIVLERTGSAGSAGLLAAATAVPLLASSLFSGTVVDTLGRRRTSVVSDLMSALSVAAIPIVDQLVGLGLGWLIVLAVLGAVFDPAGVTARETMLPAAAARAGWQLQRANGVHEAVWGTAFLLGPGLGGVLIALVGAINALWFTAVAFVCSAVLISLLRVADAGRPPEHRMPEGFWSGTREGLRFVWRDRLLRSITIMTAVLVSVYMPVEGVLLPVEFEAQDQPGRLGLVVMAMSLGAICGALGYGLVGRRWRRSWVFRGALVSTGVFLLALAALPPFWVMLVAALFIGVSYGPVGPVVNIAMQTRSPEHMRGRIVGVITSTEYAAGPFGYLLVGAATERFGVQPTFLAIATAVLVVALVGLAVRPLRELDTLPEAVPEADSSGAEATLEAALDLATTGPVPLVMPPRDPETLRGDRELP
jgi:MFS family permease